jgi:hypothetical protein
MSGKDIIIYGLIDPRDGTLCYIGQTVNIRSRYANFSLTMASNPAVAQWFEGLQQEGLIPEIQVLEKVSFDIAGERETQWIRQAIEGGAPLLNSALTGTKRRSPPRETHRRSINLPRWVSDAIDRVAAREGRSFNQQMAYILRQACDEYEANEMSDPDYSD